MNGLRILSIGCQFSFDLSAGQECARPSGARTINRPIGGRSRSGGAGRAGANGAGGTSPLMARARAALVVRCLVCLFAASGGGRAGPLPPPPPPPPPLDQVIRCAPTSAAAVSSAVCRVSEPVVAGAPGACFMSFVARRSVDMFICQQAGKPEKLAATARLRATRPTPNHLANRWLIGPAAVPRARQRWRPAARAIQRLS